MKTNEFCQIFLGLHRWEKDSQRDCDRPEGRSPKTWHFWAGHHSYGNFTFRLKKLKDYLYVDLNKTKKVRKTSCEFHTLSYWYFNVCALFFKIIAVYFDQPDICFVFAPFKFKIIHSKMGQNLVILIKKFCYRFGTALCLP